MIFPLCSPCPLWLKVLNALTTEEHGEEPCRGGRFQKKSAEKTSANQTAHCPAGTEYNGPFSIGAFAGVELRIANHQVTPPATITSMIRMAISGALLLPPGCAAWAGPESTGSTTSSDGAGLAGSTTGCVTGAAEITCGFGGTGAAAGFGAGGSTAATGGAVTAGVTAAASRGVPQALQNFAPAGKGLPHLAHCSSFEVTAAAAGAPHFKQNFAPAGISAPHAAQPAAEAAGIDLPHARQNFPVPPSALQLGHFISDVLPIRYAACAIPDSRPSILRTFMAISTITTTSSAKA